MFGLIGHRCSARFPKQSLPVGELCPFFRLLGETEQEQERQALGGKAGAPLPDPAAQSRGLSWGHPPAPAAKPASLQRLKTGL